MSVQTDDAAKSKARGLWERRNLIIAAFSTLAIAIHLWLRFSVHANILSRNLPLFAALLLGGTPLVFELARKAWHREFGSDLLAGISIVTAALLGEYLAGTIVVLMLSGGEALENYAVQNASSVLRALAKRMPSIAHRKTDGAVVDIPIQAISPGDSIVLFPHDICPVDGIVSEGHGVMDESFLTGEPFKIEKAPGSSVISGAINGDAVLTISATKLPSDSRYAKIMQVMRSAEENRPRMRRLADKLGAIYTPIAVTIAVLAAAFSGEAIRFLSVLVIATPCPLLIAIPVAIIGSISLSAKRGIIVKNAVALEQIGTCRTAIFDKTGTLTYGEPVLTEQITAQGFSDNEVLGLAASLERYSKHPLAKAIMAAAREKALRIEEASRISEPPGRGLTGEVLGRSVEIVGRKALQHRTIDGIANIAPHSDGLECIAVVDGRYAATFRFHDAPRTEGRSFIVHLGPKHHFNRIMILSGDRESEVRYLAREVGVKEIYAQKTPEEKLEIVIAETKTANTLYVGDGINDAPAMMRSTVGVAIGQNSDVTSEAAAVVIMDGELKRIDEFMHISRHMRRIALQSAIGGMVLSIGGMGFAAFGFISPVAGAVAQEVIDVFAVLNALRAAFPPKEISDF